MIHELHHIGYRVTKESAQKFMQIEIDVECIQTNFGGRGRSGFRDFDCLHEWPNFEFPFWKFPIISKNCFIIRWTLGDCKLESHPYNAIDPLAFKSSYFIY